MKKILIFVLLGLVGVKIYPVTQAVEAIVNDAIITTTELQTILKPLYYKYSKVYEGEQLKAELQKAQKKALWQLIDQKLISQEAIKKEVQLKEDAIQKQIRKVRERFGSDEDYRNALEQDGMSEKAFENKVREQYFIKALTYQEISVNVEVSPKNVQDYYEQHIDQFIEQEKVQISHLLIKKSEHPDALELAQTINQKLQDDPSLFTVLAKEHSDAVNSEEGGDMGFFEKGQLMPILEEKAFSMNVGEISSVIESGIGYHFIWLRAKKKKRQVALEEVWEDIYNLLDQQKLTEAQEEWLKKLREKAHIQILNPYLK